ncbi:hypothetical protein RRG08_013036 [Elysia crispata]|uniref:Palmitoyltransferase n=1 Tax=Elysia crispata TaxID=231223 RepID=A0AAE1A0B7_9GAST|nr:hypothetical protein RRG08_013036 [Elysia crispata]
MAENNFAVGLSASAATAISQSCEDACCPSNAGKTSAQSQIFDIIKSGMLIPVQTLVEQNGISILSIRDDKGHTPAHWTCLGGHTAVLRYMIENKVPIDEPSNNDLGAKPVHWACVNGHIAIVDILSQAGVDLDTVDNKNCTPLIVAAQYGQTMLAGYLMGKGARLQLTDKDGDNALHWAAFKGHNELMRLLIYSGFNPKQKDNYGQTVLHLACINGNLQAIKDLCEQDGVEVDQADNNGKTPLMLAIGRKHDSLVSYLKKEIKSRSSLLPRIDCWSIIFGPPGNTKAALIFFLVTVVLWGYPMYLIKCLPVTWNDLQVFHVLFMCTNVIMWICLYHSNSIDPGFLPRNIPEYDLAIKQVAHFDEWKQGQNPLSRLCHTCRTVRPLRAKHCRICNRCVREFDHHCPYIHNCVGYYNRAYFLAFLSTLMVLVILSNYFMYYVVFYVQSDWLSTIGSCQLAFFTIMISVIFFMSQITVVIAHYVVCRVSFTGVCLGMSIMGTQALHFSYIVLSMEGMPLYRVDFMIALILCIVFYIIVMCLGESAIFQAATNITTNERINRKRYDYLKDGKGAFYNPFDRGIRLNFLEFLHLKPSQTEEEVQLLGIHTV